MGTTGILRWKVEERGRQVVFLDLTIKLNELNQIEEKTFKKPKSHSSETQRVDYLEMIRLLFIRLKARGNNSSMLKEMILSAGDT